MKKILYTLIAAMIVFAACKNTAEMEPEEQDQDCVPQFPDMNVTYNNYVKGVMDKYCISCHNAGNPAAPGDFSTYSGVMVYAKTSFGARVIADNADMPQGNAPLPKAVRDSLDVWIKNCAPQN